jgi:hypothetical protein
MKKFKELSWLHKWWLCETSKYVSKIQIDKQDGSYLVKKLRVCWDVTYWSIERVCEDLSEAIEEVERIQQAQYERHLTEKNNPIWRSP